MLEFGDIPADLRGMPDGLYGDIEAFLAYVAEARCVDDYERLIAQYRALYEKSLEQFSEGC